MTLSVVGIVLLSILSVTVHGQEKFECYNCNSGHNGWEHKDCPKDGAINDEHIATSSCDERCFTRTNKWTPGVIHRGCSSEYFLPRPGLPESGCVQDPLENWWCFCVGEKCNTDDMSSYV